MEKSSIFIRLILHPGVRILLALFLAVFIAPVFLAPASENVRFPTLLSWWWDQMPERGLTYTERFGHHNSDMKARLSNLKTALVNYSSDLGHFPFTGTEMTPDSMNAADRACLGTTDDTNVLLSAKVGPPFANLGLTEAQYQKRWKGPYMDSSADDFMVDIWGNKIRCRVYRNQLWLHSAGHDGVFESLEFARDPEAYEKYGCDDVTRSVSRLRFPKG